MTAPWVRFLPPGLPAARVAACVGLIADTHLPQRCAALPPAVFAVLRGVGALLHAGDVGELAVLDQLSAIAPVVAVHGNDETVEARRALPYGQTLAVAGQRLFLCHAHYPDRAEELTSRQGDAWAPKLDRRAALAREAGARIAVFGHTHVPMARWHEGVLLVNPGAIASPNELTRQARRTVALLFIRDDGAPFVTHVDLAAPEAPFTPEIAWDAGFRAAHGQFAASILAPRLAAAWPRLAELGDAFPPAARRAALLPAARRCWRGEQATVGPDDLLAGLCADPAVSATTLTLVAAALAGEEAAPAREE